MWPHRVPPPEVAQQYHIGGRDEYGSTDRRMKIYRYR